MPRPLPPYLHREVLRNRKVVWFVRRDRTSRIQLYAEYGSKAFWQEYRQALADSSVQASIPAIPKPNTLGWAIETYRHSSGWAALAGATRKQRGNIYKVVAAAAGDESLSDIDPTHIREGRERRAATPHSANNFLKAMRGLFGWAVEQEYIVSDPTKGVALLRGTNDKVGFHTWTEVELKRFEDRWAIGTRERLAFDILLFTGLRRGDAVRLGRRHIQGEIIYFPQTEKTGEALILPLLPPLAASIAASRTGELTFLMTASGSPFAKEGFGNWFGRVCRDTGCPGSAHGLRKAGATRAAEGGATDKQLMALFGWQTPKMAAHYTRTADRRRLAMDGAQFLILKQMERDNGHLGPTEGTKPKNIDE